MSASLAVPLSIYVHLPWCVRKCPYCDFNSHQLTGPLPESRYVDALLTDLQGQLAEVPCRASAPIHSVFIGGGTPSLFSPAAIERLLRDIDAPEVTLEANPGAIERGRFAEYRAAGISRVSLGGQSFNPRHLEALGRIHSARDTGAAAEELHAAGLDNFNIDLMYGLPGQSLQDALTDVRAALALAPAHISHYQLTLEPGTPFHHRPPAALPDDDLSWQMQLECQASLAQAGFTQYEISAYAKPGRQCRHNLNYWQFGDYLGVGAGAHGKLTHDSSARVRRSVHPRLPARYLANMESGASSPQTTAVPNCDLPFEFMLNALRLVEGFESGLFEARTGLDRSALQPALTVACNRGLLMKSAGQDGWRATALGLRFLNDLQSLFLPSTHGAGQDSGSEASVRSAGPL